MANLANDLLEETASLAGDVAKDTTKAGKKLSKEASDLSDVDDAAKKLEKNASKTEKKLEKEASDVTDDAAKVSKKSEKLYPELPKEEEQHVQKTPLVPSAPPMETETTNNELGMVAMPKNYMPKEARQEKKKKKHRTQPKGDDSSSSDSDSDDEKMTAMPTESTPNQMMSRKSHQEAMAPKFMCQTITGYLMSVEFFPLCTQKGNKRLEICPRFENFSNLMRQANFWLLNNPAYRCMRCETVKRSCSFEGVVDYAGSTIEGSKFGALCYVRGLRMWVTQRSDTPPQQLWYINVLPKAKAGANNPGDVNKMFWPEFEDLRTTLQWMNMQFAANPIPGEIMNMEQIELVFNKWSNGKFVDLDKIHWLEKQSKSRMFLIGLRVYYVMNSKPANEKIGITCILPECAHRSGMQRPKFSEFDTLLKGAIKFIGQNPNVRITDLQCFNICVNKEGNSPKWKDWMDEEDPYRSYCIDNSANQTAFLVRTLRIIYTMDGPPCQFLRSGLLTTKVFLPYKIGPRNYETVQQALSRVSSWMNATRAKIIAAETLQVFHNPEMEQIKYDSNDVMLTKLTNQKYIACYRFYIDGYVDEPGAAALPPPPPRAQSSCCTIL